LALNTAVISALMLLSPKSVPEISRWPLRVSSGSRALSIVRRMLCSALHGLPPSWVASWWKRKRGFCSSARTVSLSALTPLNSQSVSICRASSTGWLRTSLFSWPPE
jgi:hypothetical protein